MGIVTSGEITKATTVLETKRTVETKGTIVEAKRTVETKGAKTVVTTIAGSNFDFSFKAMTMPPNLPLWGAKAIAKLAAWLVLFCSVSFLEWHPFKSFSEQEFIRKSDRRVGRSTRSSAVGPSTRNAAVRCNEIIEKGTRTVKKFVQAINSMTMWCLENGLGIVTHIAIVTSTQQTSAPLRGNNSNKKNNHAMFKSRTILLIFVMGVPAIHSFSQLRHTAFRKTSFRAAIGVSKNSHWIPANKSRQTARRMNQDDDYDLKSIRIGDQDFWTQQKELAQELAGKEEKSFKEEQMEKYEQRANALVGDTAFFSFMIFPVLWLCFDNPLFSLSYLLGSIFGIFYVYALGKSVATLGGSAYDANAMQGAGVGEARFAFLILLFIFVGKFRNDGLVEIPCIVGFFTYQLASLSQGLKEIND